MTNQTENRNKKTYLSEWQIREDAKYYHNLKYSVNLIIDCIYSTRNDYYNKSEIENIVLDELNKYKLGRIVT